MSNVGIPTWVFQLQPWNSEAREPTIIMSLLIVKGAGICSLYHKIHYIEIRYIEVWMYTSK